MDDRFSAPARDRPPTAEGTPAPYKGSPPGPRPPAESPGPGCVGVTPEGNLVNRIATMGPKGFFANSPRRHLDPRGKKLNGNYYSSPIKGVSRRRCPFVGPQNKPPPPPAVRWLRRAGGKYRRNGLIDGETTLSWRPWNHIFPSGLDGPHGGPRGPPRDGNSPDNGAGECYYKSSPSVGHQ